MWNMLVISWMLMKWINIVFFGCDIYEKPADQALAAE